ncbi:MAG TPA: D-alanyl-D-alanine carboxypeptidase [Candidatus Paceibacterota bacterium]|nr:D-alanyl-D-alanine carboxypeptidase [Candidatus Paceibacterota bacterium]
MKKYFALIFIVFFFTAIVHTHAASLKTQFTNLVSGNNLQKSMQSACIVDQKGAVLSYNASAPIIPASVSKLYTFDFALATLPLDFHYTTTFYQNGTTLYINGGGDPHFVIGHLRSVIKKIYDEQHVLLSRFVFSPNFYFNWNSAPKDVQWSMFTSLKEDAGAPIAKKIAVVIGTSAYSGKGNKYQFQSAPLTALLKQISDYSNNIAADTLFKRLGGSTAFAAYMQKTYGADSTKVHFETGSGLSGNFTTCALTISVIKHLDATLTADNLALTDIIAVPHVDPGVLKDRLTSIDDTSAMVAKSGFVNFHHNLAGAINTKKGHVYFAVFAAFDDMKQSTSVKAMVDDFTTRIVAFYQSTLKPFSYTPDLSIFDNITVKKI